MEFLSFRFVFIQMRTTLIISVSAPLSLTQPCVCRGCDVRMRSHLVDRLYVSYLWRHTRISSSVWDRWCIHAPHGIPCRRVESRQSANETRTANMFIFISRTCCHMPTCLHHFKGQVSNGWLRWPKISRRLEMTGKEWKWRSPSLSRSLYLPHKTVPSSIFPCRSWFSIWQIP